MSNIFEFIPPTDIYKPPIDSPSLAPPRTRRESAHSKGYADLEALSGDLRLIKNKASRIFDRSSSKLSKFSIKVDTTNAALMEAHDLVYPDDKTPGYITFDEYKYLMTATDSNEIQYLKKYYEKEMRGPSGSGCLDCLNLCRAIHLEVERINDFIEKYIGDLDETAEFRTVELFQDWTQTALPALQTIEAAAETEVTQGIPRAELARLTPELSKQYQALFQAKLNALNKYISEFMELFEKTWNSTSDDFYELKLGPGLLFQVQVGKNITDPANADAKKYPTLYTEMRGAMSGLSNDFDVSLTDQLKRNMIFDQYIKGVTNNYYPREYYKYCINQLGIAGTPPVNNFVDSASVSQAEAVLNAPDPLTTPTSNLSSSTGLRPSHFDLVDREESSAHPQYLLRSGGEITGDIKVKDKVKIDGVDLSLHRHSGSDGSSKILGQDIAFGTLSDDVIDPNATTPVPKNLKVNKIDDSLATRVTVELKFEVPSTSGIAGYQFEVVKLSG